MGYKVGVGRAWLGNWNFISYILGVIDEAWVSDFDFILSISVFVQVGVDMFRIRVS